MKSLLLVFAVAGLTGCAVYPAPAYDTYGNAAPAPYIIEQPSYPAYIYGGGGYRSGGYYRPYPGGYYRPAPPAPPAVVIVPQPRPQVPHWQQRPGRGNGDRDRDGIPNRLDRDRDGDGIPNRLDRDRNNDGIPDRIGRNRDRDGDGIPNRRDPLPNIPNHRQ